MANVINAIIHTNKLKAMDKEVLQQMLDAGVKPTFTRLKDVDGEPHYEATMEWPKG